MRELSVAAAAFAPLTGGDPHRPRLTVYTADGARTELSTATLLNMSAKVAGLLTDELGAAPGDRVFVSLTPGWQTAPVLLGAWWAGLVVTDVDDPDAVAAFVPDGADPAVGACDEVFVVSGHPLGAPSSAVAVHQRDFTTSVLGQADRFPGVRLAGDAPAVAGTMDLTIDQALELAAGPGWSPGVRLASVVDWSVPAVALPVLVGPLTVDGSVLQLPHDTAEALSSDEKATATAGLTLPGLPRLFA